MQKNEECTIDRIMYLIDWNRSEEEQQEGIALGQKVSCLKAFFQPIGPGYSKSVWDNCAVILCHRTDEELEPYVGDMLLWLEDLNWPGAELIQERLVAFRRVERLAMYMNAMVPALDKLEKRSWLEFLSDLLENSRLEQQLDQETLRILHLS